MRPNKNTNNMAQSKIANIDKTIMDNFYKLVHSQQNIRLTAASSTFKILKAMNTNKNNKNSDTFNENLNYSLERLVSGLASSRALARRGYGTLLLELLNNFQVSTERLFTIAEKKFGHISKETPFDNLIGYFLLISIVLESGNHKRSKANTQYLEKIYNHMIHLHNIKSYLGYSVSKLLVQYTDLFHSYMVDTIPQHAFGADVKLTTLELLLITLCHKNEPIREFSNIDKSRLLEMCSILLNDKFQKKPLHPIFAEVCLMIIKCFHDSFEQFYTDIIFPTFFKSNHNELAGMGFELMASILKSTNDTDAIKTMFNQHVIRTIILSLRNKTSLKDSTNTFIKALQDIFETNKDSGMQYIVLQKLTNSPGSLAFDDDSKSSTISNLLNKSSPTVLKKYLDDVMTMLNSNSSRVVKTQIQQSCAKQIAFIVARPQLNEEKEIHKRVTKFMLINSLFKVNSDKSPKLDSFFKKHCIPKPTKEFDSAVLPSFKKSYQQTLDHLISCTSSSNQKVEQLDDLISFVGELMSTGKFEHVSAEVNDSLVHQWDNYWARLETHKKVVETEKESKNLNSITLLYFFYGLQIVEHGLDCETQLEELNKSTQREESWADVLTDQLLAILSATECSNWIRKLTETVFDLLLPNITQTSIDLICDAVKTPPQDGDLDSEDDEGDADDDDDEDSYAESSSDDEMSNGNEILETTIDEAVDMDEVSSAMDNDENIDDENPKKKLKKDNNEERDMSIEEINPKGPVENSDDSDEDYLDDEQMMKLDSVLADMFRLNRIGKKKTEPTFQLRCLDLVRRILIRRHGEPEIMNPILATIIPLAMKSRKTVETKPISDKIRTMLTKLPAKVKNGYEALKNLQADN